MLEDVFVNCCLSCLVLLQPEKKSGTIKEQLAAIAPALEKFWKQKDDRMKEFSDVQSQIQKISAEIAGISEHVESPAVDESDLSTKKLSEFRAQLQDLQKEKVISITYHQSEINVSMQSFLPSNIFIIFFS